MTGCAWRYRLVSAAYGLVAIVMSVYILVRSVRLPEVGPARPRGEWLLPIAPTLLVIGIVVVIRALAWGSRALSGRNLLVSGLVMLAVGGFPWVYTPLIVRDRGMEGSGMLGTLIFLVIGVPGVLVTLVGFFLREWGSD